MLGSPKLSQLVLIRGAGDLASGVAYRLWQAGFPVVMLEAPQPTVIRRTVSFATAVFEGAATVEGLTACKVDNLSDVEKTLQKGKIPLLVDPVGESIPLLKPNVVVDAVIAKKNVLGTRRGQAPLVIALGPGFTAGTDVDAVVETMRGHYLGRVIWQGSALPNTGVPGAVGGFTEERVIRAPKDGIWQPIVDIGHKVQKGQTVAMVDGTEVKSQISGVVRGLLYPGIRVSQGMKAGDVDPRAVREHCFTISDKALAVGGGVLEAVMHWLNMQGKLNN